MKKLIVLSIASIYIIFNIKPIQAQNNRLISEVHSITVENENLIISGWALIENTQHYIDHNTHAYEIILQSSTDTFVVAGELVNISQTDNFTNFGATKCNSNELIANSNNCNYTYDNVGFKFTVPLEQLNINNDYEISIKVIGKHANIVKQSPLYYANEKVLTFYYNQTQYLIDSTLQNSQIKILNDHVPVRNEPRSNSSLLAAQAKCNNNPQAYFQNNSVFNNVFAQKLDNNNVFYKLKVDYSNCQDGLSYVKEGNEFSEVWINTFNVAHLSKPLSIKTKIHNTRPKLTVRDHVVVRFGTIIDKNEGVSAYDVEDGDLANSIVIESDNYTDYPGEYEIKYSVTDKFGDTVYATTKIVVLDLNADPTLVLNDAIIKQYEAYNPLAYAKAYDFKLNDISNAIVTYREINTYNIGEYEQCYSITDNENRSNYACSAVSIVPINKDFRFIQTKKLFHKETVPIIWSNLLNIIKREVSNQIVYDSIQINK